MEYHAFRKDQLLTHTQLNDLINFFEDQDRLTRTCLTGVGLVCGLVINYDTATPAITVGKGCGVTTDGDLLMVESTTYKHFKPYINRKKGTNDPIYDPFFPVPDGSKQIDLWELVVPNSKGELPIDSNVLGTFNATTGKQLDDMVALLYLEYYLQDPDKCTAIDCDNQGPHQIARIKVLLLSKVDMEKVINRDPAQEVIADSIYKKYHNAGIEYFDLPILKAKRVILNAANTAGIALLAKSYTGIVQSSDGKKLIDTVENLYNGFQFMIDPGKKTNINDLLLALKQSLSTNTKLYHAQYLYDFYKDIITCYNELRELVFKCMYECCPDKYAFPKHIMLGELKPFGVEPVPYRHEFYPSPALGDNKDRVAQCRSMWLRMQQLIQQFHIQDQPTAIKITPSTDYDRWLEKRAVPFYYKDVKSIVKNWNYQLSRRGAEKTVLSYHAGDYGGGIDSTMNPLDYNIDTNNFFRIEGHLGKQLGQAMAGIDKIKNDKSIPFDLVAIRMNKTGNLKDINIDDFDCQFEDLIAILKAWLIEQNCLYGSIARFFSGFSTNRENGFHTRIDDYRVNTTPSYIVGKTMVKERMMKVTTGIRLNEEAEVFGMLERDKQAVPICRTVYTIDKTIEDNLETNKDSLGIYFSHALQQLSFSADDMIASVKNQSASDPHLSKLTAEEREIVYEAPITMVAHIADISKSKPYQIDEINLEMLERYMEKMERLCAYVKLLRSRMEGLFNREASGASTNGYVRQGFESYYLFLIQQLIANCCAAEKLESLLEEINRRKQKILDSLLLANYAKQHPGLEHKAGVHRGGTFVLVYAQQTNKGKAPKAKIVLVETAEAAPENLPVLEINRDEKRVASENDMELLINKVFSKRAADYEDIDSFAYYLVVNQGQVDFNEEVERYMKLHHIKSGTLEEQAFNRKLMALIKELCARLTKEEEASVAANVVIADFTLPYLCCSDCPPMTFIMPKQEYNLSLPKASACNDEGLLEFRKEPADGIVKAPKGLEKVIVDKDDQTFFDPAQVPAASFGKSIAFTINDQVTDCTITVFKHPVAKAAAPPEEQKQDGDTIVVVYKNLSDDDTGKAYVYEWDFGDKRATVKATAKDAIVITYSRSVLDSLGLKGKIPVKLKASNGPCSDEDSIEVSYQQEEPVSLSLPGGISCDDVAPFKFDVHPVNGVVASADVPATVIKPGTQYLFDPSKVPAAFWGKPITFTVNGKATTCSIKVFHHPKVAFNATGVILPGGVNLFRVTFTNLTDPLNNQQLNYRWKFGDGTDKNTTSTATFTQDFDITDLKKQGRTALPFTLFASNPGCEDKADGEVPFPLQVNVRVSCIDTVKAAIDEDSKIFTETAFVRSLSLMRTTAQFANVSTQLKETRSILSDAAAQTGDFGKPATQEALLNRVMKQLLELYNNQFDQDINDAVIMPQIRVLLRLALNVVKCTKDISGTVKEILIRIFNTFKERAKELAKHFPALNKDNVLANAVDVYLHETLLADTQIITAIKDFGNLVKEFFKV